MVRQAHTYLVSAMSGATLIAAAIAVFVVLVSVQVFEAWPITGFGGGGDSASVSPGRAAEPATAAGTAAKGKGTGTADSGSAADATAGENRPGSNAVSTGAAGDRSFQPGGGAPAGETGSGAAPDGAAGSPAAQAAGNGGGGADGAGGGKASGGGGGSGGGGAGAGSGSSPSGNVTNTVNETVNQVDQTVTGGALEKAGVTGLTEEVVDGVLGPESTVGKVVDGAAGAVGGLLSPKR